MLMNIILIVSILYMFFNSFFMNTGNFKSFLLFKFLPFILGIGLLFKLLIITGYIIKV